MSDQCDNISRVCKCIPAYQGLRVFIPHHLRLISVAVLDPGFVLLFVSVTLSGDVCKRVPVSRFVGVCYNISGCLLLYQCLWMSVTVSFVSVCYCISVYGCLLLYRLLVSVTVSVSVDVCYCIVC